jgi:hypothetical protein
MHYLLLIDGDEHALSETERQACYVESRQRVHELEVSGQYRAAHPLHPTAMAITVHVRDGKRFVTDSLFAETREQLSGAFLLDAQHLDEAVGITARIPMARQGTVESRPVLDLSGLPTAWRLRLVQSLCSVLRAAITPPGERGLLPTAGAARMAGWITTCRVRAQRCTTRCVCPTQGTKRGCHGWEPDDQRAQRRCKNTSASPGWRGQISIH